MSGNYMYMYVEHFKRFCELMSDEVEEKYCAARVQRILPAEIQCIGRSRYFFW